VITGGHDPDWSALPAQPLLSPAAEGARLRRRDALDAFEMVAMSLEALRRQEKIDPTDLVAAEARVELARERFWAADAVYRDTRHEAQTG
jgi:hypothetical protein